MVGCCSRTLGDDRLVARCLTQNSYERHLAAKLSSPKVLKQHDHCFYIIRERTCSVRYKYKREKWLSTIQVWLSTVQVWLSTIQVWELAQYGTSMAQYGTSMRTGSVRYKYGSVWYKYENWLSTVQVWELAQYGTSMAHLAWELRIHLAVFITSLWSVQAI